MICALPNFFLINLTGIHPYKWKIDPPNSFPIVRTLIYYKRPRLTRKIRQCNEKTIVQESSEDRTKLITKHQPLRKKVIQTTQSDASTAHAHKDAEALSTFHRAAHIDFHKIGTMHVLGAITLQFFKIKLWLHPIFFTKIIWGKTRRWGCHGLISTTYRYTTTYFKNILERSTPGNFLKHDTTNMPHHS